MCKGKVSAPVKSRTEGILQGERLIGCQGSVRTNRPQLSLRRRPTERPREVPDAFRIEVIEVHLRGGLGFVSLPLHRRRKRGREVGQAFSFGVEDI